METLPTDELRDLQTKRLRRAVERAKEMPVYRDFFAKKPLSDADFQSPEDVRRLPLTTEEQLIRQPENGLWSVPRHEIARLQLQKNTLLTAYTRLDNQLQADLVARLMYGTGTRSNQLVQITRPYNRTGEGLAYQLGVECIGAGVIPHGDRNEEFIKDPVAFLSALKVEGICTDYDYISDLFCVARETKLPLRYAHIPVEFKALERREDFEKRSNIKLWLNWSHPAFFGAGMANECFLRNGLHLQEDVFLFEILDPKTLEPVPDGEPGELVVTDLVREAQTILRFRTGMMVVMNPGPCPCGRTGRRVTFKPKDPNDWRTILGVE